MASSGSKFKGRVVRVEQDRTSLLQTGKMKQHIPQFRNVFTGEKHVRGFSNHRRGELEVGGLPVSARPPKMRLAVNAG